MTDTTTHQVVSIQVKSRHNDWNTTLDCAVLPNITGITPATTFETAHWNLPTDILIGADVFFEILLPGRRTHGGN